MSLTIRVSVNSGELKSSRNPYWVLPTIGHCISTMRAYGRVAVKMRRHTSLLLVTGKDPSVPSEGFAMVTRLRAAFVPSLNAAAAAASSAAEARVLPLLPLRRLAR